MTRSFAKIKLASNLKITPQRAVIELIFAGLLWGFGFVATTLGLQSFSLSQFLFLRFFLSWLVSLIIIFISFPREQKNELIRWSKIKPGLICGALLGLTLILQTIGLKYTTAARSGFITTLYVIFVPLIEDFLSLKKNSLWIYFFAVIALIGTWLLTGALDGDLNIGDLWTLGCSFLAAFHILAVGRFSKKSDHSFLFNTNQSFMCLLITLPLILVDSESWRWDISNASLFGLFMNIFGSTIIAFTIQVRAQKVLSTSLSSMLFLLESPFAAIFGYLCLTQTLSPLQTGGAALILLATILTIQFEATNETRKDHYSSR